jgi:hypothetical protein
MEVAAEVQSVVVAPDGFCGGGNHRLVARRLVRDRRHTVARCASYPHLGQAHMRPKLNRQET